MTQRLVILCPGQGAQGVGMGRAWFDASPLVRDSFAEADAVLAARPGFPGTLSNLCFNGPADQLNRTDICQPALYVVAIACYRALKSQWGDASLAAAAGLSLGEYSAFHLAGAFSFADGLRLVAERGRLMQQASESTRGSMVAIVGGDDAAAQQVADDAAGDGVLVCANFNAPGQVVLSGDVDACSRAVTAAQKLGLRATPLTVAGAFHSPLMQPAADRMAEVLDSVDISPPVCPVVSNVTARPHDPAPAAIRRRLVEQIVSPVRWSQSCEWMTNTILADYHEMAPGKVIAGAMRRINRQAKVISHDTPDA